MVNITAEIHPPAAQVKTRKLFAFGFVKMKLGSSNSGSQAEENRLPADELRVLGLLVVEDQDQMDDHTL